MHTDGVIALAALVRGRANDLITRELRARGVEGVVPAHGSILHHLYQQGELPMGRLAVLSGRPKNTVTSLVRTLVKHGYLSRRPDPSDSRVSLVALTAKGAALRAHSEEISRLLLERAWGDMPQEERQALVEGLARLADNLA